MSDVDARGVMKKTAEMGVFVDEELAVISTETEDEEGGDYD